MKERRKIEVKKKKIRRCIFALWCILAIIFLIAVNIYNGNEKAENVISDLVRIYIGASFIIIGIIYKLGKNYICLFNYLFISSQMSAKPYFIGSTGILLLW